MATNVVNQDHSPHAHDYHVSLFLELMVTHLRWLYMDGRTSISLMPPHISGTKYYYFFFCEEYTEECTVQCVVPSSDPSHRALPFLSYPTLSIFWVRLSSLFAISPHINFENKIFLHQTSFPLHSLSPLLLFSYSLSPSISAPCLSLTLSHTHTHTNMILCTACMYVQLHASRATKEFDESDGGAAWRGEHATYKNHHRGWRG